MPPFERVIDRSLNYGRHLVDRYLAAAAQEGMGRVLDLGAGSGSDLLAARRHHSTAELYAIEVHPPYQRRLTDRGIIVHPGNLERDPFPFGDGQVDVVIANQVLEHVKEVFWVLHETTRVLRVGGKLIVGVPNLASLHNRLLLGLGRQPTCIQNRTAHVRGYTRRDLLALLDCFPGGYLLRQWGGSNFYPLPPLLARPLAAALPSLAWGLFMLLEKTRAYRGEYLAFPAAQQLETNFYLGRGE